MKDDDYGVENLKKLKYIEAVQNETHRMYGPGNMVLMREAIADHQLAGVPLRTGTVVQAHMIGIDYDGQTFENPF